MKSGRRRRECLLQDSVLKGIGPAETLQVHLPALLCPLYLHALCLQQELLQVGSVEIDGPGQQAFGIDDAVGGDVRRLAVRCPGQAAL